MHYIAALNIDGFYICALKAELDVDILAVVLTKEKQVLDVSKPARDRGVAVGQSVSEARAILGKEGSFIEWKEGRFTQTSEQWMDIAAEFTGTIEPCSEHGALLDLSGHPDPLKTAIELKEAIQAKFAVSVFIGIGPNRWIAEASCGERQLSLTTLLTPRAFIRPLSTLRLEPVEWKDRERLMALGYRTIGDVAALSFETLRELFGKRAFVIAQAAQGSGNPRVVPGYPLASRAEYICFDSSPENWSEIEEMGRQLAKRLGTALSKEDLSAHDLEIVATSEDGSRLCLQRSFTAPLKSAKGIEKALALMLTQPFEKPLERLLVRLKNLEQSRRVQQSLEGFVRGADRTDALELALKSLNKTFGAGAIEKAGALPVARFQAVRRAWQEANGWVWR